ncbi:hypothetical protein AB0230_07170 [Microbacterium sp. NPDC089190]|uniref:hypothetical protein n=1 Tax=Microbacterium sp. NPDC089190 TaxID=3155063 RepID=UPI0034503F99
MTDSPRLSLMFMARRSDRRQQAKRDRAALSATPEPTLYEHPLDAEEERYPVALMCKCRISQRLLTVDHALVYFAIVWSRRNSFGTWTERYSVDTGHGYFHEHTAGHQRPNDRRDIRPLYSQVDVQECFDNGYDRVQSRHDHMCEGGS